MGLRDIINGIFGQKTAENVTTYKIGGVYVTPAGAAIRMQEIAESICRDYIASAVSKCEIRTFVRNNEVFGDEYYRWNIKPNSYQTSTEFWREIVDRVYDDGEALILPVDNQLIIADGFSKEDFATKPARFTDVYRGDFTFSRSFDSDNAIYINIGDDARVQLSGISELLNSTLADAIDKYTKDGGEHGTLKIDSLATGTNEGQERLNQLLNEDFAAYFKSKNAVLPLYEGYEYTRQQPNVQQKTAIVTDITALLNEAIAIVAQVRKVPPALVLGQVADTKTAVTNFLTFCIDPFVNMVTEAANAVLYGREYLNGSYLTADTSYIMHTDIWDAANSADKLRAASIANTNEIRRKIGEPPIKEAWADEYALTKNYENINNADGGE